MIIGRAANGKMHSEIRLTMNCSGAIGRMRAALDARVDLPPERRDHARADVLGRHAR